MSVTRAVAGLFLPLTGTPQQPTISNPPRRKDIVPVLKKACLRPPVPPFPFLSSHVPPAPMLLCHLYVFALFLAVSSLFPMSLFLFFFPPPSFFFHCFLPPLPRYPVEASGFYHTPPPHDIHSAPSLLVPFRLHPPRSLIHELTGPRPQQPSLLSPLSAPSPLQSSTIHPCFTPLFPPPRDKQPDLVSFLGRCFFFPVPSQPCYSSPVFFVRLE